MMREKIVTDTKLQAKRCEICGSQVDPENPRVKLWTHTNGFVHERCYMKWLEHSINERYKQEGGWAMKKHNKHRKIEGLF